MRDTDPVTDSQKKFVVVSSGAVLLLADGHLLCSAGLQEDLACTIWVRVVYGNLTSQAVYHTLSKCQVVTADFASGTGTQLYSNCAPVQCSVVTAISQRFTDFTAMFTDCTLVCVPQAAHVPFFIPDMLTPVLLYSGINICQSLALSRCAICDPVSRDIKRILSPGSIIILHAFVPETSAVSHNMHSSHPIYSANACSIWLLAGPVI